jgi:hypothetical protein
MITITPDLSITANPDVWISDFTARNHFCQGNFGISFPTTFNILYLDRFSSFFA